MPDPRRLTVISERTPGGRLACSCRATGQHPAARVTHPEAIQFLYRLQMFGARFGLKTPRRLAALVGHPHERLRFIHVAGTNGKGSTCAMLESIYREAGLRVGLFTSPHLVAFGERMQVNRAMIPELELIRLVEDFQQLLQTFPADAPPTLFEVVTVMALRYFAEQGCDLVIWETGLGGRLDATNIVTPLASVITNIDFDHQQWLGDTLDKIAAEKSGIIKSGVPVLTGAQPGRGLEVITSVARENLAPLTVVTSANTRRPPLDSMALPLLGEHQRHNAALAVATVRALAATLPVSEAALRAGLEKVNWPGRMQLITRAGGGRVLLDGAHNAAGALALRAALASQFPGIVPAMILGSLADKDWAVNVRTLAPLAGRLLLVPVSCERSLAPAEMLALGQRANPAAMVEVCASLAEALEKSAAEPFLVITGSLYLIGEAMERLGLSSTTPGGERGLNEWGGNTFGGSAQAPPTS